MHDAPVSALGLSHRGRRLITERPVPGYIDEHFARVEDRWEADTNPDGYVPMCIAENKLVWDLLEPKMEECRRVPRRVLEYDAMVGTASFREALAGFLSRRVLGRSVETDQVVVLAGSGTVLETVFYALADPGEAILIPTPSYAGFWPDIETRDELQVIPVHTSSTTGFRLTPDLMNAAADTSPAPVRALLFTSPNNPTGQVYSPAELDAVIDWADGRGIHLVMDELFALSVYGDSRFVSGASRRPELGERRHIVWAFSKDFAASGLRCGVLISENEDLIEAVDGLAYWAAVSGDTQFLLEQFVSDDSWADGFIAENARRLGDAYRQVTAALDAAGVPYMPSEAGFFFLCDMRSFMSEVTWEAEAELWRWLLEHVNVNLTPGADCHIGEPGFMRLVFASERTEAVVAGVERMGTALAARS
jgi:aspartate/methionine/tyrosine aminotransferase